MRYTNKYGIIIVMIEVEWIIQKVEAKEYYFSNHGDKERQNDDLSITVYIPTPPKFVTPYQRG